MTRHQRRTAIVGAWGGAALLALVAGALPAAAAPLAPADSAGAGGAWSWCSTRPARWADDDGAGRTRRESARGAVGAVADALPDGYPTGLRVYGADRTSGCADTRLVRPVEPLDRDAVKRTVDGVRPKGDTPIGLSLGGLRRDRGAPARRGRRQVRRPAHPDRRRRRPERRRPGLRAGRRALPPGGGSRPADVGRRAHPLRGGQPPLRRGGALPADRGAREQEGVRRGALAAGDGVRDRGEHRPDTPYDGRPAVAGAGSVPVAWTNRYESRPTVRPVHARGDFYLAVTRSRRPPRSRRTRGSVWCSGSPSSATSWRAPSTVRRSWPGRARGRTRTRGVIRLWPETAAVRAGQDGPASRPLPGRAPWSSWREGSSSSAAAAAVAAAAEWSGRRAAERPRGTDG